jgi:uncharacterized protein YyaL (SSP411 family)
MFGRWLKFVKWLKNDSDFFEAAYGITAGGNWEGKTVLQRALDDASLAARFRLNLEVVPVKLAESHSKLYSVRALRIRPGTDDKILTAWNGLMLAAFAEAARRFFWTGSCSNPDSTRGILCGCAQR